MGRRGPQQGAALILVIGVIATLAVLSSALVFLIGNAASNTARDRNRAKAFNMAEAAIDLALFKVGTEAGSVSGVTTGWPLTSATAASLTDQEKSAFLGRFPESEFPGARVSIVYFDSIDNHVAYDADPADGQIYIEAQALVGGQRARIQVKAQRIFFDNKFPRGIAAATDGNIWSNAVNPAVGCEVPPGYLGEQTALTAMAGGTIIDSNPNGSVCDPALFPSSNVLQNLGTDSGVVGSVLDPSVLQQLIKTAKTAGRWYSDIQTEIDKGAKPWPNTNTIAPFEGIVVLETVSPMTLDLNGNGTYNGTGVSTATDPNPKPPGVLMVIGPKTMYPDDATTVGYSGGINLGGVGTYYGIMYTDGSIGGNGTVTIAGMALARNDITLAGNRRIVYNDSVLVNLSRTVQISAQIVPDTWRQIQPTPGTMP